MASAGKLAQLFISRNNDSEVRTNEHSLTHSQFQLRPSFLSFSFEPTVPLPFSLPRSRPLVTHFLLLFHHYPFYRGRRAGAAFYTKLFESVSAGGCLCVCARNRLPLFVWSRSVFPSGKASAAVSRAAHRHLRAPLCFCFTRFSNFISRIYHASLNSSANRVDDRDWHLPGTVASRISPAPPSPTFLLISLNGWRMNEPCTAERTRSAITSITAITYAYCFLQTRVELWLLNILFTLAGFPNAISSR